MDIFWTLEIFPKRFLSDIKLSKAVHLKFQSRANLRDIDFIMIPRVELVYGTISKGFGVLVHKEDLAMRREGNFKTFSFLNNSLHLRQEMGITHPPLIFSTIWLLDNLFYAIKEFFECIYEYILFSFRKFHFV